MHAKTLRKLDIFGIVYCVGVTLVVVTGSFVAIPSAAGTHVNAKLLLQALECFLVFNALFNSYLCIAVTCAYEGVRSDAGSREFSENFCITCNWEKPPLCHHCPSCKMCVAKRDHHCFFLSTCIGQRNLRYFVVFCFHAGAAALLGFALFFCHLRNSGLDLFGLQFYKIIAPISLLQYVIGYVTLPQLLFLLLSALALATALFALAFFVFEMYLVRHDVAMWDYLEVRSRGSGLPRARSFRAALGPYWLLDFLFPVSFFLLRENTSATFKSV